MDPGLRPLIAPLVTFLPGGVLTTATVELASGEMVAGASRLVFGAVQLLLLSFGIVAGAELAGLPAALGVLCGASIFRGSPPLHGACGGSLPAERPARTTAAGAPPAT